MIINLTGVSDAQVLTVTASGITDLNNNALSPIAIPVGFLIGDTNGNHVVNASDIGQTKAQPGMPVTSTNFREDVNVNGAINASDIGLVKSKSGGTIP